MKKFGFKIVGLTGAATVGFGVMELTAWIFNEVVPYWTHHEAMAIVWLWVMMAVIILLGNATRRWIERVLQAMDRKIGEIRIKKPQFMVINGDVREP